MHRRALGILTAAIVASMTILPMTGAAAAEPLPVGAYDLTLDGSALSVLIGEDGTPSVSADDGLIVVLSYDETGRVLDHVRVETADHVYEVAVEVAEDGSYTQTVTSLDDEQPIDLDDDADAVDVDDESVLLEGEDADVVIDDASEQAEEQDADDEDADDADADAKSNHGTLVSTVAHCAPRGRDAKQGGWPNHGSIVSAAASGLTLDISLADPQTGEPSVLAADFGSLEGAQAFCAAVDAHRTAALDMDTDADVDVETDASEESDSAGKAEKKAEKTAAKSEKAEAKREAKSEKAEAKRDRKATKAESKNDKQDKSDKTSKRGRSSDEG